MARPKKTTGFPKKKKQSNTITIRIDDATKAIVESRKGIKSFGWSQWFRERVNYEFGGQISAEQEVELLRSQYIRLQDRMHEQMAKIRDDLQPKIDLVARELSKKIHGIEIIHGEDGR
jgi:hypothetical protein